MKKLTVCVCVCVFLQYESSGLGLISSRLRTTLNRIQENLIDMVKLSLLFPLFFSLLPSTVTSSPFSDTNMLSQLKSSLCLCPYLFSHHPTLSNTTICLISQLPSPHNALWVIIIWPVVTHTYTHLPLFKWGGQGGYVCFSIRAQSLPSSVQLHSDT